MPQGRRNRILQGLRSRDLRILVATDVAARGIDVPTISHVVNYELPMKPEDYVHRIGRTGRAGRDGLAVTLAERFDAGMIRRIQQFTTQPIPVATIGGLEPRGKQPKMVARPARGPAGESRPVARGNPFDRALSARPTDAAPSRRPSFPDSRRSHRTSSPRSAPPATGRARSPRG